MLLHGLGSTREDFWVLRPELEADYDVLAVDLPGQGHSPALSQRPPICAVTDAIESDLGVLGLGRMHVLATPWAPASRWNSHDASERCQSW